MAIDIGASAADRDSTLSAGTTAFGVFNPANADGSLDTVEVWFNTDAADVKVATFYGSGSTYTSRDYELIGNVTSGSKQTFTGLDISVATGDYIGEHSTGGLLEKSTSGSGIYFAYDDYIDGTPHDYQTSSRALSVYGTGTESGGGGEKTSSEAGTGVENVAGRGLSGGEAGSGAEGVLGRALFKSDTGQGSEYAHILGLWEVLFSGDVGRGADSFKALTARTGPDARMQTGFGQVGLPHKEVNL